MMNGTSPQKKLILSIYALLRFGVRATYSQCTSDIYSVHLDSNTEGKDRIICGRTSLGDLVNFTNGSPTVDSLVLFRTFGSPSNASIVDQNVGLEDVILLGTGSLCYSQTNTMSFSVGCNFSGGQKLKSRNSISVSNSILTKKIRTVKELFVRQVRSFNVFNP